MISQAFHRFSSQKDYGKSTVQRATEMTIYIFPLTYVQPNIYYHSQGAVNSVAQTCTLIDGFLLRVSRHAVELALVTRTRSIWR
jgi:hypothetical protein